MTKEERFYGTLKNMFIGIPVEGESGYVNLMRIKARYFERVMMPRLGEEIAQVLQPFLDLPVSFPAEPEDAGGAGGEPGAGHGASGLEQVVFGH